jgi:hypothetical protein
MKWSDYMAHLFRTKKKLCVLTAVLMQFITNNISLMNSAVMDMLKFGVKLAESATFTVSDTLTIAFPGFHSN